MKKLYFSISTILFGAIFGLSFVKGDIIDSNWDNEGVNNYETDDSGRVFPKETNKQVNINRGENWLKICNNNYIFCPLIDSISRILVLSVIIIGILYNFFFFFIKNHFKKNGDIIPIKINKKTIFAILIITSLSLILKITLLLSFFKTNRQTRTKPTNSFSGLGGYNTISGLLIFFINIILIFSCSYILLTIITQYYRLFRKFGWNKWYSILGAIFFPIGICILGVGDYQYQGKELEDSNEK